MQTLLRVRIITPFCHALYVSQSDLLECPGGEIGRRRGLKIPRRKACRFDSGPGHQLKIPALPHNRGMGTIVKTVLLNVL